IQLGIETLHEEVTVHAPLDAGEASPIEAHVERMTAQVMRSAPLASERFQDALPLIPGVVRGPDGLLNINGTRSNQSALRFNSADGTDPVTGEASLVESAQYEHSQTRVFGLPAFESDTEVQGFESYTRVDWSIGAAQRFTAAAMISPRKTTYAGLNTFNPQAVTPNIRHDN